MYYLAVYNREEKAWDLEAGSENTTGYNFLHDAAKAFALAVKIHGAANAKLLRQVPVVITVSAEVGGTMDGSDTVFAMA